MKFLIVLSLLVGGSALSTKKPGKQGWKQKEMKVLASTTRSKKQFCKNAKDIEQGFWVSLKEDEFQSPPEGAGCNPERMMWEPQTCKLPYHSNETKKTPGRVIFVGDSISDISARSFAWYYDQLWAKDLNACTYQKADVGKKLKLQLLKGGFNAMTVADTQKYIEEQGFNRNHHWWGCSANVSVSYIPTDTPPPQNTVKAFMFAVKNFGAKPLGPQDTIVLNWGMWADKGDETWGASMKAFMQEYKQWMQAKTAPKLIWREVSPTHWGADTQTGYSKDKYEMSQITKGCSPAGGPKQMEHQMKKTTQFPLKNTNMFKDSLKATGLKVDGVNIEFLPIWRGSAERYEDHQPLTKYQIDNGQKIDCTHYCTHGNVNRFWNSALGATISAMKEKEVTQV